MDVTLYHNPKCATSRKALALLRERGVALNVIDYVKTPPSREQLVGLLAALGMGPRGLLRRKGTPYDVLGLGDPALSDAELIDAILAHPILMERPVIASPKGALIGRPVERLLGVI